MSKVVQDLETQLASLKEENVGLCSSLEELDLQHQGALGTVQSSFFLLERKNNTVVYLQYLGVVTTHTCTHQNYLENFKDCGGGYRDCLGVPVSDLEGKNDKW